MKKLIKDIIDFFLYLKNFRTILRLKKINKKLHKTIEDREVDRIILKGQIIRSVRKFLNIDAKSIYIPKDYKNKAEIKEKVLAEFGEDMNKLSIRINDNLELV